MRIAPAESPSTRRPLPQSPAQSELAKKVCDTEQEALILSLEPRPYPFDGLDPAVRREISARWRQPCEAMFEYLAENVPGQLLVLLKSPRLSNADLTIAAEISGRIPYPAQVRAALIPLLSHSVAYVREAAIYGLVPHLDHAARARLTEIARTDVSPGVRAAAAEAIEEA